MILADFWVSLNASLKITVVLKQPSEYSLLNLLVIFLFKKLIAEKLHGPHHKELSLSWRGIESTNGPICWKTNWT